jgi:putative membrane protein
MAMGIANVIPGVSGGTIALITEIYEELINSLKSFDLKALKLLISLDIKRFIQHTNFYFLLAVFGGSVASVFSIANLFKFLFASYTILIWAFFFGLIVASVYFVGKRIKKWDLPNIIALVVGTAIAISLSFITPATENSNLFFVFICGIIGVSGMMLPGLSGSFILILMGNYKLLMVTAITELNYLLSIFIIGSAVGLMSFSHALAWVLKHYKDATLALLTGFILGSLNIIWPWKKIAESMIIDGKEKVLEYHWYFPNITEKETLIAFALIVFGIVVVWGLESFSPKKAA